MLYLGDLCQNDTNLWCYTNGKKMLSFQPGTSFSQGRQLTKLALIFRGYCPTDRVWHFFCSNTLQCETKYELGQIYVMVLDIE